MRRRSVLGADDVHDPGLQRPRLSRREVPHLAATFQDVVGLPVVLVPEDVLLPGRQPDVGHREAPPVLLGQEAHGAGRAAGDELLAARGLQVLEPLDDHDRSPCSFGSSTVSHERADDRRARGPVECPAKACSSPGRMRLAGKVALISGGARGMGAVEARLFAREGARVVIGDILEAEGRSLERDIRAAVGEALFVRLDVTCEADWQAAVDAAVSRFGRLDILINNAGVGAGRRVDQRARSRGVGAGGATVNAFRPVSQSA